MKLLVAIVLLLIPTSILAHEVRPAYLELREERGGDIQVIWKTPARGEMRLSLTPEFLGLTEKLTPITTRQTNDSNVQMWRMKVVDSLRGQNLRIDGLEGTMTDVLVRVEFADGTTWTQRLTPQQPAAFIPARTSRLAVAGVYTSLGVEHILTGIDHLLFVLALIIITRGGWKLVKTVTAFTLSHTLTLTAATLGWVHVPQQPVEAIIALSIVFVAAEIVQGYRGRVGIAARAPWIVALAFGLLHGLGFAGGLSEVGLPTGHIPTALLFFSVGVEFGHFLFVGAVIGLAVIVRRINVSIPRWAEYAPPYLIGCLAMFWVIQRTLSF
jgi:hydrogenase/urease accessory protein HupE